MCTVGRGHLARPAISLAAQHYLEQCGTLQGPKEVVISGDLGLDWQWWQWWLQQKQQSWLEWPWFQESMETVPGGFPVPFKLCYVMSF